MTKRQYAEACPLLAESYRIQHTGGTLQNLAVCYEELGKWASSYARFQDLRALSASGPTPRPERVALADEHIARLTPLLSRVVVVIPTTRPRGVVVKLDDLVYEEASWSAGILVDPGPHVLLVEAPGRLPFRTTVHIGREGTTERVSVAPLANAPATPTPSPAPASTAHAPTSHGLRTLGFVAGGVGLASLAAGGVFGVLTITKNDAGRDKCSSDTNPSASRSDFDPVTGRCFTGSTAWKDANDEKDTARTFANVANVLVPVGIVGLGIGAILVWQSKTTSSAPTTARVVPSLGGASLEGTF